MARESAPSAAEQRQQQGLQAQARVLGIVMLCPHLWPVAAEGLSLEHYTGPRERALWSLLAERAAEGASLEMLSVCDALIGDAELEQRCGGLAWVSSLPEQAAMVGAELLPHLISVLRRARERRRLQDVAALLDREIESADPEALGDRASRMLAGMADGSGPTWRGAPDLAQDAWRRLDERSTDLAAGVTGGWPTPWPTVDRLTGGLRAPQVWVIGGRPGLGKSAVLLQLLLHLAFAGRKVGLLSLEMPTSECVDRWIAQHARVDVGRLRDGALGQADRGYASEALSEIARLSLWVDDRPATQTQVRTRAQLLARRLGGLDVLGVDYLQLVRRDAGSRYGSKAEEVGDAARTLQALAKELGCVVVACAQVGRQAMARADKRPGLTDLRESGDIEAVADTVLMPWRWDYEAPGTRPGEGQFLVRKARHGQTGEVEATWKGAYQRMEEK